MLLVGEILSFIFVANSRTFFPHAVTLAKSFPEITLIIATVGPIVLSIAVRLALRVLSLVQIPVSKFFSALPVF